MFWMYMAAPPVYVDNVYVDTVYIVIQNDRDYTNDACHVIGVYDSLASAKRGGWLAVVEHALQPWKLGSLSAKDKWAGLSDFYIEEWEVCGQSKCKSSCRLGWIIAKNTHISLVSSYLKDLVAAGVDLKARLEEWKGSLVDGGDVPGELSELER